MRDGMRKARGRGLAAFGLAACLAWFMAGAAAAGDAEAGAAGGRIGGPISLRAWGMSPDRTAEANGDLLQAAIDWASPRGAALWLDPDERPYPVRGGIRLRRNVSIMGAHGPLGRGSAHPDGQRPVGSVFSLSDTERPFLTVESATRLEGLQFHYPDQTRDDPDAIVAYPPTITCAKDTVAQGVTLARLSFYGSYFPMDFRASIRFPVELLTFEHCVGYPLGGRFIAIDHCYDIPRVLHCHVNPAIQREFGGHYARAVIDAVAGREAFAFDLDHTDNAQLIDLFAFGVYGGLRLGPATYGQLTNFNFDCVRVGILKRGDNDFNRTWQIAQGSIIANLGAAAADCHPLIVEGRGHTALTGVETFSGGNAALTTRTDGSREFLWIRGNEPLTVGVVNCRMGGYAGDAPVVCDNPSAVWQAVACFDKHGQPLLRSVIPRTDHRPPLIVTPGYMLEENHGE